jgi:Emfourin
MMRVRIERRGGLAGRLATGERQENELSPAERAAIQALLRAPPPARSAAGADRFQYIISVVDDSGTTVLNVPEDLMPAVLAAIPRLVL